MRVILFGAGVLLGTGALAQLSNLQTLELAKPATVVLSPDGARVAYVSARAVLKDNEYQATLFVVPAQGGAAKALVTEKVIGALQWSSDGNALTYLVKDGERYQAWRVALDSGDRKQLTHHSEGIGAGLSDEYLEYVKPFKMAPDGQRAVFFTRNRTAAEREREQRFAADIRYTAESHLRELFDPGHYWAFSPEAAPELWLVDLASGKERLVWKASEAAPGSASFRFEWSLDGKHIVVFSPDASESWLARTRVDILSTDTFVARRVRPKLGSTVRPSWSADSRSITFLSEGEIVDRNQMRSQSRWYRYSLEDDQLAPVDGAGGSENILADRIRKASGDRVHDCSADTRERRAACVRESAQVAPQVVVYDIAPSGAFSAGRVVTRLNPELEGIELGKVSEMKWQGEEGDEATFGLILPAGYRTDRRYPLIVMLYNQYQPGEFAAIPSQTNYAPQVFATHGYAVLLQNTPKKEFAFTPGDFEAGLKRHPEAIAGSLRSMLDELTARGVVDPQRMGIMGWSWGHFYTTYVLTHYPQWFRAGAAGDGCNHQPTFYWINPQAIREQEDRFFGGGPIGRYAERWRQVSPILNVDKLRAPLLLEYSALSPCGVELYQAIQEAGGKSEMFMYPQEEHVFERPANRYTSMQRHFDWFNFWLLGEEDPQPQKAGQYARWRKMPPALTPTGSRSPPVPR